MWAFRNGPPHGYRTFVIPIDDHNNVADARNREGAVTLSLFTHDPEIVYIKRCLNSTLFC